MALEMAVMLGSSDLPSLQQNLHEPSSGQMSSLEKLRLHVDQVIVLCIAFLCIALVTIVWLGATDEARGFCGTDLLFADQQLGKASTLAPAGVDGQREHCQSLNVSSGNASVRPRRH